MHNGVKHLFTKSGQFAFFLNPSLNIWENYQLAQESIMAVFADLGYFNGSYNYLETRTGNHLILPSSAPRFPPFEDPMAADNQSSPLNLK